VHEGFVLVVEVDGERGVGDLDGDRPPGVVPADGEPLTGHHDHAVGGHLALHPDPRGSGQQRIGGQPQPAQPPPVTAEPAPTEEPG
jgi:hypothetical protein